MAMDADYVTNGGGGDTNSEQQQQQPQPRKRFLPIRPNVALPFLASLFPCLRHRATNTANTAPPVTSTAPAAEAPTTAPTSVTTSEADLPPASTTEPPPPSNNVLMSVDDFARFIRSVKDLLQGTPLLWNRFLEVIETFVPPPAPPPTPASPCHAEG